MDYDVVWQLPLALDQVWAFCHQIEKVVIIKHSQGNTEKVENPYKIGVSRISVSESGYKTPYFIRPVPKLPKSQSSDLFMGLIYQFMR